MRGKVLGLGIAALAASAVPAFADGMTRSHGYRYDNAVRADGVDWTGLYSGLHSGGVTGKTIFVRKLGQTTSATCPIGANPGLCSAIGNANAYRFADMNTETKRDVDIDGFHVGPHIGYQKQFGRLVLGADIGFSVGGGEGSEDCGSTAVLSVKCESEYKYSYNLRGRIGYATGNSLFYVMAGVTRARIENRVLYTDVASGETFGEKGAAYPNGVVLGLGWEYQDARGMRWSLSYTHLKFEDVNVRLNDPYGGGSGTRTTPDPDVLGAALKIPLQQQAAQAADPGPPAAQAPAVAQAAAPAAAPARPRPAAQPAAAPAPARVAPTAPAAAPAAAPRAPAPRAPVQGTPAEPDEPAPTGRPKK